MHDPRTSPALRTLQDRFDSRALADTLEFATVKPFIGDDARAFVEARAFFFLSTVDAEGHPAPHVPDSNGEAPLAAWKKTDLLQDVLPERFQNLAEDAGGS